jgi:hypothetical protein
MFYGQFAGAPTPAHSFAQRLLRALGVIGLTFVGAYPEPKARWVIGARGRQAHRPEAQS